MTKKTTKKKLDIPSYITDKNPGPWKYRLLIGTASTGLYREEWVGARFGQIIPTNWAHATISQTVPAYAPIGYLVSDAQNLIVKHALENNMEWVLFWERDNVPAAMDYFIKLNEYMHDGSVPVVSGLYFTKSFPPEPMVYREAGRSYYTDWKLGDKVWTSGVPTGFLLIHNKILKAVWDKSPEYNAFGATTRRVFFEPAGLVRDPELGTEALEHGTSDLAFCKRCINEGIFEKAGWPELQKTPYPFLVDTNLFTWHVDDNGRMFPLGGIPAGYMPEGAQLDTNGNLIKN